MARKVFLLASFFGLTAIALSAYHAHALRQEMGDYTFEMFQKGLNYQYYHAFFLMVIGLLALHKPSSILKWSATFAVVGILFFSGSLYLISTGPILGIETFMAHLRLITPTGGMSFILAWLFMGVYAYKEL